MRLGAWVVAGTQSAPPAYFPAWWSRKRKSIRPVQGGASFCGVFLIKKGARPVPSRGRRATYVFSQEIPVSVLFSSLIKRKHTPGLPSRI